MHDFYTRNLLEPGWAGELDRAELAYIKSQLWQSPSLKRRWGFRPSAKRLSTARIRAVAMHGISSSVRGVLASPRRGKRRESIEDTGARPRCESSGTKKCLPRREDGNKGQVVAPAGSGAGRGADTLGR